MSTIIEKELKFKIIQEQLDNGLFNEPYIEVEVGDGEDYIRGTDAEGLIKDILDRTIVPARRRGGR